MKGLSKNFLVHKFCKFYILEYSVLVVYNSNFLSYCNPEAGFLCSIESDNNVQEDDLKEILNVLNVGELRELVNSVIDEVCI